MMIPTRCVVLVCGRAVQSRAFLATPPAAKGQRGSDEVEPSLHGSLVWLGMTAGVQQKMARLW